MTTLVLLHTAWLTGWLLVLPALCILEMCRGLAFENTITRIDR